ncbi:MAG: hypothetical protein Unbinned3138contig1000_12 [Prokaryotic dsDNA virus sp.]|nr:MAG: hypothetical protein Unbinned3138contig1000_12 [Prokaryotic dsDNA virus sp.]|tara:strand:+ start:2677 stop:3783 length:1107 start_codon:yes stop_codon:yes gene_type:complete
MTEDIVTRPSAAPRWTRCALAPTMTQRCGERPVGDEAREGTCAAWVAEMVLTGQAATTAELIGESHENGWIVDDEMTGHVQDYVDLIRGMCGSVWAEVRVVLAPTVAGTLDAAVLLPDGTLIVLDLKYGFRIVKPTSEQLVIYAGALARGLIESGEYVTRVVTAIYQPRGFASGGTYRTHDWTLAELHDRCDWIIERAADCRAPNPTATPGPHCRDCDGAGRGCDALASTSAQIMATIQDTDHGELDAAGLARQLEFYRWATDVIKAASDGAETEAMARHKSGDTLPGYGLTERMGQTKVTASRQAIEALTGAKIPVKEKPPAVKDLRDAKLSDAQIALFTHRPSIGWKLEPLDQTELVRQFKGVGNV